jgi:hypothetical protein
MALGKKAQIGAGAVPAALRANEPFSEVATHLLSGHISRRLRAAMSESHAYLHRRPRSVRRERR